MIIALLVLILLAVLFPGALRVLFIIIGIGILMMLTGH